MEIENQSLYIENLRSFFVGYVPIGNEAWTLIKSTLQFQTLKKGDVLLREGQTAKNLHFIAKGVLRAYFMNDAGNIYNKNIFLEGSLAGSMVSLLLGKPSYFTLEALEDTVVINLNFKKYKEFISQNDDLKNFYIAYIEKNWIVEKEQREISIVMEDAMIRYLKFIESSPGIEKRVPLQHIASHLGITPTQLSRIRKELKEKL